MAGLPPPPINEKPGSFVWLEWYRQLRNYVSTSGSVPWYIINFSGSNITDIANRSHNQLQDLQGGISGEMHHLQSSDYTNLTGGNPKFDTLTIDKTSGNGIKVDKTTPTFPWQDQLGKVAIRTAGANDPTWAVYRSTIRQFQFSNAIVNEVWNEFHIPHDYVPGTDLYIHVHWSQTTVDTGGAGATPGNVKWYFDITYAKGHGTPGAAANGAFSASKTTSVVQQGSTTQYGHQIAETVITDDGTSLIDRSLVEPDGLFLIRTYRDPADAADTLNQNPWVHEIDIHYQSTNIGTKNKSPNFYS